MTYDTYELMDSNNNKIIIYPVLQYDENNIKYILYFISNPQELYIGIEKDGKLLPVDEINYNKIQDKFLKLLANLNKEN